MSIFCPLCHSPKLRSNVALLIAKVLGPTSFQFLDFESQIIASVGTLTTDCEPFVSISQSVLIGKIFPLNGCPVRLGSNNANHICVLYVSVNPATGFHAPW